MNPKVLEVKPLPDHSIWIKYSDGKEGIIDLNHLAGKGVFKVWDENDFFKQVHIDSFSNAVAWDEELELCPDALYLKLG